MVDTKVITVCKGCSDVERHVTKYRNELKSFISQELDARAALITQYIDDTLCDVQSDGALIMCEVLAGVNTCIIDVVLPPETKLIVWLPKTCVTLSDQNMCAIKEVCLRFVRSTACVIQVVESETINGELTMGYEDVILIKLMQYHKGWLTV